MPTLRLLLDEADAAQFQQTVIGPEFMHRYCMEALDFQTARSFSDDACIEISLSWLSESAIKDLNYRFRGKSSSTNVLSFPAELPVLHQPERKSLHMLGDIILCPPVIEREAIEQRKPLTHHWAHLLVHGTLHLCGYDHEQADEALAMETAEAHILAQSGISDPYVADKNA